VRRFESTDELRGHVEQSYAAGSWYELTESGRQEPELFLPWLAEQVVRDFDKASVVDRDLAISTGPSGAPLPGPGRRLQDWRLRALGLVSGRLAGLGFEIETSASAPSSTPACARDVGEVLVRRHGFETRAVVRVDPAGEIYVRLHDDASFAPVEEHA